MSKILITEDEINIRNILCKFLEKNGHNVKYASNGNEAIEIFNNFNPDLVFMDINMPKKDGIEATKEIVKNNPSAKICILSAIGHKQAIDTAIKAGATTYLTKPFKKESLINVINTTL